MNITFEIPEVLITSACILFCCTQPFYGWIFLSLGIAGSVFRTGLKIQEKTIKEEKVKENIESAISTFTGLLTSSTQDHDNIH